MKKIIAIIAAVSLIIFTIDWLSLGIMILNGNYDFLAWVYIGAVCLTIFIICVVILRLSKKCPHCGKFVASDGTYCPYCGGKL